MRPAIASELLQLLSCLAAEEILYGVEDRPGMRLHRNAIFGPQDRKVERRHDGRRGRARRLVPADLEPVAIFPQVIGVVDRPRGQPKHFALEFSEQVKLRRRHRNSLRNRSS